MCDRFSKNPLSLHVQTPTLFVDFDGTLHRGRGVMAENGEVLLDSGNPPFEYAQQLAHILEPYPKVEIVLTTSWLEKLSLEKIISFLPIELSRRIVGTTHGIKPRFGYVLDGSARTYVIRCYVFDHKLKNWLAIDDNVYGAQSLSFPFLNLANHLVLLDSQLGISSEKAQERIQQWLCEVHTRV